MKLLFDFLDLDQFFQKLDFDAVDFAGIQFRLDGLSRLFCWHGFLTSLGSRLRFCAATALPFGSMFTGLRRGTEAPALLPEHGAVVRWRLKRPGSDETIFPRPRSRPEMNTGYQRPRIKRRGFELFSNDQSSKRSDLRIRRLHAVRSRDRIFRRTGLMRRGPKPRAMVVTVSAGLAQLLLNRFQPFSESAI